MKLKTTLSAVFATFAIISSAQASRDVCYRQQQTGSHQECNGSSEQRCHDETSQECTPTTRRECGPVSHQVCTPTTRRECTDTSRRECHDEWQRECHNENRRECTNTTRRECNNQQVCRDVPDQVCRTDSNGNRVCQTVTRRECNNQQVCRDVPDQVCHDRNEQVCRDVPRQVCRNIPDQVCRDVPDQVCRTETTTECRNVPDQVCRTTTHRVCEDVPGQTCHDVPTMEQVPYDCGSDNGARPVASNASIFVNGNRLNASTYSLSGHLIVPIRALFEALGATVTYSAPDRRITATYQGRTVQMTVDSRVAVKQGSLIAIDTPPTNIEGSVYIPLRFAAESLDAEVVYNASSNSVTVTTN